MRETFASSIYIIYNLYVTRERERESVCEMQKLKKKNFDLLFVVYLQQFCKLQSHKVNMQGGAKWQQGEQ